MNTASVTLRCQLHDLLRVEVRHATRSDLVDLDSYLSLHGSTTRTERGFDLRVAAGTSFQAATELAPVLESDGFCAEVVL